LRDFFFLEPIDNARALAIASAEMSVFDCIQARNSRILSFVFPSFALLLGCWPMKVRPWELSCHLSPFAKRGL
jgi:hypothetical protein